MQRISIKSEEEREPSRKFRDDSEMIQSTFIKNGICTRQKTADRKLFLLFRFLKNILYVLEFNRTGERLCNLVNGMLMQILSDQVPNYTICF